MKKNKVLAVISAAVVTSAIAATMCCSASAAINNNTVNQSKNKTSICCSMPNPFTQCDENMEKAAKVAGFDFNLPKMSQFQSTARKGMIDVKIQNGDFDYIHFRKSTDSGNISGDYNKYNYTQVNDTRISDLDAMFGIKDGKTFVVYWHANGFSYSITSDKGISTENAIGEVLKVMQSESVINAI